ncbi:MAG: hypothetical protein DBX47_01780 [Clostridiales bacterium]|nr:MAG: hypothetical protein DBX47_01780 [Clostridiales bacterium]
MKKGISACIVLCIMASFLSFANALPSFAFDLTTLTKATTPEQISAATAEKNNLLKNDTANKKNSLGYRFGFFYDYYYGKITLPKYQNLPDVAAYKNRLEMVTELLKTQDLYLAEYYSEATLENMWHLAREKVPVSEGWNVFRTEIINTKCEGLWANPDGIDASGTGCKKYTTESWAAYYRAVCWGDTYRKTCTDVQGEAAINDIYTKYQALVQNPDYIGPPNAENLAAYNFCIAKSGDRELYAWYVYHAYQRLTTPDIWTDSAVVQAFIDKAIEADSLFLEAYNNNINYKEWIVYIGGAPSDMILEQMWVAAREKAYIGPILKTLRDELFISLLPQEFYTPDSWAVWESQKQSLSDTVDDIKNSINSTDQDGYNAIQDIKTAIDELKIASVPKPTIKETKDTMISLNPIYNCEYSIDGLNWQDSNIFNNLFPNKEYTFYQRVKATQTKPASVKSEGFIVKTLKSTVSAPAAPVAESKTDTSVTLSGVTGCEYSMDGNTWQESNIFNGLTPVTDYTFYIRYTETETAFVSAPSMSVIKTLKTKVNAPATPVSESIKENSVTITPVDGCEYSIDGIVWQSSNIFVKLNPSTEYNFYIRYQETDTTYASDSSNALTVTTLKGTIPGAPILESCSDTTVTLKNTLGCEYSMDGEHWQESRTFTNLSPITEYTFYQRYKETNEAPASEKSEALITKTQKSQNTNIPTAPVLQSKNDISVTLEQVQNCEYSLNGTNWVLSNVFENLLPNKEYTFYVRYKETDTTYASEKSVALTVTTLRSTITAPAAPEIANTTDKVITLKAVSGCEYSLDGTTWQASNVFQNLLPNKEYTLYARYAQTDTTYASEKSAGLKITTLKSTINAPEAPVADKVTISSVMLKIIESCEYSIDGTTWQSSNVFNNLKPSTEYKFYIRYTETDTTYASPKSAELAVTTKSKGDVDGNSKISLTDAMKAFQHVAGKTTLKDEMFNAADIDGNGKVELPDAMKIFQFVAGKIKEF